MYVCMYVCMYMFICIYVDWVDVVFVCSSMLAVLANGLVNVYVCMYVYLYASISIFTSLIVCCEEEIKLGSAAPFVVGSLSSWNIQYEVLCYYPH